LIAHLHIKPKALALEMEITDGDKTGLKNNHITQLKTERELNNFHILQRVKINKFNKKSLLLLN
jgi:hypothetical protein